MYNISHNKLLAFREYLANILTKGHIHFNFLPALLPILFIKKPGGGLWLCIDFQKLNVITKKNRYLLPLIRKTINNFFRAKRFIKLNIIAAFNKLKITPGEKWKTMFYTYKGLFKYCIMLFNLYNILTD